MSEEAKKHTTYCDTRVRGKSVLRPDKLLPSHLPPVLHPAKGAPFACSSASGSPIPRVPSHTLASQLYLAAHLRGANPLLTPNSSMNHSNAQPESSDISSTLTDYKQMLLISITNITTGQLRVEGTPGGHLVQPMPSQL